ncbi:DUF4129 domain-containing protein [bacterium SCSIO 12741]|nr:DUF4129 domain-containing protein [bacterium SCSIO 12741]
MKAQKTYRSLLSSLVLLIWIFCSLGLFAQDSEEGIEIEEDKWEETIKDVDYSEDFWENDDDEEEDSQASEDGEFNPDIPASDGFSLGPLKYVFIIAVIMALLYVIIILASNYKKGASAHSRISGAELEELESLSDPEADIEQFNLDSMLASALKLGNYKLALRIQYLKIVQLLSESGAIDWKKEKTNYDYLRELKDHQGRKTFQTLTRDFEKIWYGDLELTEKEYQNRAPQYEAFQKTLTPDE